MRKGILLIGLGLMFLMSMGMVSADDTAPKPGTPEDNECYPGGVLYREENQDGCPTVWYWKAGWFLARYNQGLISREDFPKEFASVLPPEQAVYPCWSNTTVSLIYMGPPNQRGNITFYYSSLDCTGPGFNPPGGSSFIVFANNKADAIALCAAQGSAIFTEQLNSIGYANAPSSAYGCTVA